jgi:hypothetical protein
MASMRQFPARPLTGSDCTRIDRARARPSGGGGIGLAIVRQIIEAYARRVGASSGGGRTQVWFSLLIGANASIDAPMRRRRTAFAFSPAARRRRMANH